jgi:DNA helicase II / ATP-dependent DNA helicase PcrA
MVRLALRHAKRFAEMSAAYLDKLNADQRRAVLHGVDEAHDTALLIIAGAGSGKTATLGHRVVHLVANGADPRRILLMTFSRRAAVEMTRRVERIGREAAAGNSAGPGVAGAGAFLGSLAGALGAALPWAGTFHAIGARLLRDYAAHIGVDPTFTIHDREDSADLMNLVRHDLGFSAKENRFPTKATCLAIYSRAVNAEEELAAVLMKAYPWCAAWEDELRTLFAAYLDAKQRQHVLDYDDLLLYWAQMMCEPSIAADVAARFDHVLVDEYQDTNRLQASILMRLKPDGRGLTVVGDDAQAIYSFRAATVRNILDFPTQFREPAAVVTLARNYRSTEPILAASNAVISLAAERFTKDLWSGRTSSDRPRLVTVTDEAEQARYVAHRVLENRERGSALKAQAVLFRASHHSAALEIELAVRGIPFIKFGGLKFLDSAHVKDVLACLRFAENPRDRVSGFRVLQLLPGVGPAKAGHILDAGADATALADLRAPGADRAEWPAFAEMVRHLSLRLAGWPAEIETVRRWYEPHLERRHDDAGARKADLVQLEEIAASYPSRERFLTELTLDPPDATSDEAGPAHRDEDYLILSTIHSAKGQEWSSVFVLNVVDGCIPSDLAAGETEEIEEERRLLYVAMTRAKNELDLIVPQRFYVHQQSRRGDRHLYAARTRFIPAALLRLFEQRTWPVRPAAPRTAATAEARIDVAAKLRARWR